MNKLQRYHSLVTRIAEEENRQKVYDQIEQELQTIEKQLSQMVKKYQAVDEDGNPTTDNSQGLQDLVNDLNKHI